MLAVGGEETTGRSVARLDSEAVGRKRVAPEGAIRGGRIKPCQAR